MRHLSVRTLQRLVSACPSVEVAVCHTRLCMFHLQLGPRSCLQPIMMQIFARNRIKCKQKIEIKSGNNEKQKVKKKVGKLSICHLTLLRQLRLHLATGDWRLVSRSLLPLSLFLPSRLCCIPTAKQLYGNCTLKTVWQTFVARFCCRKIITNFILISLLFFA